MKLGTRKVNNVELDVHANAHGRFWLSEPDSDQSLGDGDTLDAAVAKTRIELNKRKVKIEVPFKRLKAAGRIERGVATGVHGGTRNIMARVNGKTEQLSGIGDKRVFTADTPDEVLTEIARLDLEARELTRRADGLRRTHMLDLDRAVRKAIEDAAERAA